MILAADLLNVLGKFHYENSEQLELCEERASKTSDPEFNTHEN
jgi:hypothetical protein